ncbi:MAG: D-alanyl-D-alanine carboxypeptidase family protein [Oscillospiraceae bacterium]
MLIFFKKIMAALVAGSLVFTIVYAEPSKQVDTEVSTKLVEAKSGILMEQTTGEVLYEFNPDEKLPIASVTKTMSILLIMEALDSGKISLEEMVSVSEHAASMGGSQVFLEPGEQMSVDEMLKAIVVSSGNDAAVAMAEFVSGSEEAFVEKMNERAKSLGCENTHFINCNGLDETTEHYSSARDVGKISCELLKHKKVLEYTTIWMDTIRDGKFGLSNTNKLIRFYDGANGLKTGSTSTAKYCLSAAALRDDMQLVAVVLCAPSTKERFDSATRLLDYGFANYSIVDDSIMGEPLKPVPVIGGISENANVEVLGKVNFIVKKGNKKNVVKDIKMEESVKAPTKKGDKVGEISFKIDDLEVAKRDIVVVDEIKRINPLQMFVKMLNTFVMAK